MKPIAIIILAFTLEAAALLVGLVGCRPAAAIEAPSVRTNQVAARIVATVAIEEPPQHVAMPPRWTLLCDGYGTYTARAPNGFILFSTFSNRQEAIDYAWRLCQPDIPKPQPDWKECE